ncbi:uncharacterized protein MELLADRAFT_103082 [Melampsora larici-populina 98AG31]|uniref:Uncharacterized protein n=1 Tax=Melampsora larici-populina (strain 98AG31 / pathotype 3-4-7) TaxID=747676 RepID=F4RAH6_MELLP|nr:uncharacterized protein MELLADRAFT_103082 [Melampsora larici-populina 98AG31]EGG10778.1 hypothetical protein MELLADRAFT_103082 [Melampsora larici-populina 98AG31]
MSTRENLPSSLHSLIVCKKGSLNVVSTINNNVDIHGADPNQDFCSTTHLVELRGGPICTPSIIKRIAFARGPDSNETKLKPEPVSIELLKHHEWKLQFSGLTAKPDPFKTMSLPVIVLNILEFHFVRLPPHMTARQPALASIILTVISQLRNLRSLEPGMLRGYPQNRFQNGDHPTDGITLHQTLNS